MSRTRTTPDSPMDITDRKKGKFDKKSHDPLAKIFKKFPPRPPGQPQNPVAYLIDHPIIKWLAEKLENSDELVRKANHFLVLAGRNAGAEKFSVVVRETWLCLTSTFCNAADSSVDAAGLVLRNSNRESATQRWDRMKREPSIEPCLSMLGSCSEFDVMRLFLSILIGYWGDKAELPNLDDATGKPYFGNRIAADDNFRTRLMEMSKCPTQYENFSYEIKDADDAKNMESVRGWVVTQYGDKKNVDIDALVETIKSTLLTNMKMGLACGLYDGKAAIIEVLVADAWRASVSMVCRPRSGF